MGKLTNQDTYKFISESSIVSDSSEPS